MPKQTTKRKYTATDYLIGYGGLVFMLVLSILIFKFAFKPIPTPTDAQVWDALAANGYSPIDKTEQYVKDNPTMGIERNITCITDGLRAEVFVFEEVGVAMAAYNKITAHIGNAKRNHPTSNIETGGYRANYVLRTLKAGGQYYYLMRISNTLFYAYCDEEHISEVNSIAKELGYIR